MGLGSTGASAWHSSMNWRARSGSRLATATSAELPALRIAFQFLRAIWAVPRIPQRQSGVDISGGLSCGHHYSLMSVPNKKRCRAVALGRDSQLCWRWSPRQSGWLGVVGDAEAFHVAAGVLPAVAIRSDVPQADGGVGPDAEAAAAGAFAKG